MSRKMMAALAVAVLAMLVTTASAQTPGKMNYQVMLTSDSDEPLAEQEVDLFFAIYDSEVAGTLLWSELHSNVMTNSIGVASVILGTTSPLTNYYFQGPAWLEISVDAQTLTPRRELVAAPYAIHADDADNLGELPASYYALAEDLYVPGVINTPSNPVDWTNLKNVPAGFADGTDDTGGAGDGHSLDASDGSPVDALYVDATGQVGIGVTNPANNLVIDTGAYGLAYAQFVDASTGYTASDGFEVGINGAGNAFINQQENASIAFLTNGVSRGKIDDDGTWEVGSTAYNTYLELYGSSSSDPVVEIFGTGTGGSIDLYDEEGDKYGFIEPDVNGTGGFLRIEDSTGGNGLTVDGNYSGGDTRLSIFGSASGTIFNTHLSGDDAVNLPTSAVSSLEIENEAGLNYSYSTTTLALTGGSPQTMLSRSIYCPTSGYVLAIGTAEAVINHTNGTASGSYFGVSDVSSSFPAGSELYSRLPLDAVSGQYYETITAQFIFNVSSGAQTFYFLADEVIGDWTVYDRNLSVVFFPTFYGVLADPPARVVTGTDLPGGELAPGQTGADVSAERAECEAANNARIEAELAAMEAKIAEIRASMDDNRE